MTKTYTGEPMSPDHPLGGIYAIMDRHGMLPDDIFCTRCAKPLNMDGGHPAELYAGTYNGLCYGCTGTGPYVAAVAQLDGCRRVSWPPHSPSWRRDREDHYGYEGCETCGGLGIVRPAYRSPDNGGGKSCPVCLARWTSHPVTVAESRWSELMHRSLQATFDRAIDYHAGVPRKCTKKRRQELRQAFMGPVYETDHRLAGPRSQATVEFAAMREPYRLAGRRIRDMVFARFRAMGSGVWIETTADPEEFYRQWCRWRKIDPDLGLAYGYPDGFRYAYQPKPMCHEHRHFDGCDECTARIIGAQSLQTIEDWYHLGHISSRWLDAYRHLWATSAHRYSTIPWGWEAEPEDPKIIEAVALMRRAAEERKAAS
jgi:hypothetical protein